MGYPTTPLQVYSMTADRDPTNKETLNIPIGGDGTPIALDPVYFADYITLAWKNTTDNTLWYLQSAVLGEGGDPYNAADYTLTWTQINLVI